MPEEEHLRDLDVVLCLDMLYHRDVNPWKATVVIANLMRPGGLLVINVAAKPCLQRDHDSRVHSTRQFLAGELLNLVKSNCMDVERMHYWNSWLTPLLWLKLQLPRTTGHVNSALELPHNVLNAYLSGLLWLEYQANRLTPLSFSSSLLCHGRK